MSYGVSLKPFAEKEKNALCWLPLLEEWIQNQAQ